MAMVRYTMEEIKRLNKSRDMKPEWDRRDAMTDAEILKAAAEDPDTYVPTEEELKRFKPVRRKGLAESEKAFEGAPASEDTVVLILLHKVLLEIYATASPEEAKRLAEVVENAPLRLSNPLRSPDTLEIIRIRARKLGVAEKFERLIKIARGLADSQRQFLQGAADPS